MAPDCSVCLYWPRADAGSMARLTRETLLGTGPLATGGVYLFMNIPKDSSTHKYRLLYIQAYENSDSARGLLCNGFRARLKVMSPPHCETRRRRDRTSLRTAPTAGLGAREPGTAETASSASASNSRPPCSAVPSRASTP
jgi:hypothetical protein